HNPANVDAATATAAAMRLRERPAIDFECPHPESVCLSCSSIDTRGDSSVGVSCKGPRDSSVGTSLVGCGRSPPVMTRSLAERAMAEMRATAAAAESGAYGLRA